MKMMNDTLKSDTSTLEIKSCRICGNSENNRPLRIKELNLGLLDEFEYFECGLCKCIQIAEVPENLNRYYPSNYYSYSFPVKNPGKYRKYIIQLVKKRLVKYHTSQFNLIGFITSLFMEKPFPWLTREMADFNASFLDIGTGAGRLLFSMQRSGFKNLTGIDPYIEKDLIYDNGINIYKKDVFQLEGKFDIIMLHHSFEHMSFPLETLQKLKLLLNEKGLILIRIPITGGYAWRKYKELWAQLDAPRHLFIHSIQSMQLLCKKAGFKIENITYDSTIFQFTGSEKYLRGISNISEQFSFSKEQIRYFQTEAKRLNNVNDGDSACFYIKNE
jgi:SAM-dependent methyltransferase